MVSQVVQTIEVQIPDGRLPMGARLPAEDVLAESLGVSRPLVQEAVQALVTKGLLETRQGAGSTIGAVTHEEIATPLTLLLRTWRSGPMSTTRARMSPHRHHAHEMHVKCFSISHYPVTNAEFRKFLDASTFIPKTITISDEIGGGDVD